MGIRGVDIMIQGRGFVPVVCRLRLFSFFQANCLVLPLGGVVLYIICLYCYGSFVRMLSAMIDSRLINSWRHGTSSLDTAVIIFHHGFL